MATKSSKKPKLTDHERHERFIDMVHEIGASEDPKDFDKAFEKVVKPGKPSPEK